VRRIASRSATVAARGSKCRRTSSSTVGSDTPTHARARPAMRSRSRTISGERVSNIVGQARSAAAMTSRHARVTPAWRSTA
jgi:hypothetical protein